MDDSQPSIEGHRDSHTTLSDSIHVRRDDWDVQMEPISEVRLEDSVAGKNFGIERCERDIIVGEPDVVIRGKKCVSALVKLGIEVVRLFACCHVGQCPSGSYFG